MSHNSPVIARRTRGRSSRSDTRTVDRRPAALHAAGLQLHGRRPRPHRASSPMPPSATGFYQQIAGTPLIWLVMLAPLAAVLFLSFRIERMSVGAAQATFWGYAALMGLSLAGIFLVYTGASVARVFFISAGTFAAMSLYGYTTRRDLSQFGSFLFMGLIGIVLASLVNIFIGSSALQFAISVIGVLVFTGLTA